MSDAVAFIVAWSIMTTTLAALSWLIGYIVGGEHMRRRMIGRGRDQ